MKIGSIQGISHAHYIRDDEQELRAVKANKAMFAYKKVEGSFESIDKGILVDTGSVVIEISAEAVRLGRKV